MSWETKRFSQIISVTKGEAITRAGEEDGSYPVILGGQEPAYFINRYNHEGKAIVISRSGASAGFASFWNEPIFVTDGFLVEPFPNNSIEFVFYLFKYYGKALRDLQNGSAIPHVTPKTIYSLRAPIPPEKEQRRIADILSAYDNLIEVNNKRIKVLEQMAENLYKEWFVRFRFPGHETAEFENGLPKGWEYRRLGEFICFERGVSYSSSDLEDGDSVLLSMNNIRPFGGFISDYSRAFCGKYKKHQIVNQGDLIMSVTDMTQDRRIIGYTGLVGPGKANRIISMHLLKLSSVDYSNAFLNYLFNSSGLSRLIAERATGTNVLGMTIDILNNVRTLCPPPIIAKEFSAITERIISTIHNLEAMNDKLVCQRDLLLPRLMSGKIQL